MTTGCDNPQSNTAQGCDNYDNLIQNLEKNESESDRFLELSLDEENLEINSEWVVTPVTVVTEPEKSASLYPELVGKRIRSLVSAKVGVVKEVLRGVHIPVMVIVQFDSDEFTIPTSPEKLAFEDVSSFPKLESVSSVSEKGT